MVKKRVPDWLNSSLWSTPQHLPSSPPSNAAAKPPLVPIVDPPPPVPTPEPPRTSVHAASAARTEIKDPLSGNYGSNSSVCHSDEENGSSSANSIASAVGAAASVVPASAPPAAEIISKQAQLLQEVFKISLSHTHMLQVINFV